MQLEAGDQLSSLQARWTSLVSGNLQLELANMTLEMEVDALREREAELSQQLQQVSVSS
jgi:pre-mRNA-splicing factor SPF27